VSTISPALRFEAEAPALVTPAEIGQWAKAWKRLLGHKLAVGGLIVLASIILLCALGPVVSKYTFDSLDLRARFSPPTPAHLFGTDELGRDAFVRVLYGGRNSLAVGFIVSIGVTFVGTLLGGISGFVGGTFDNVLMRVVDFSYALPEIVVLLVLSKIAGSGLQSIILILLLLNWTRVARLARGVVLSIRENAYVEAARASGARGSGILIRHVLPNAVSPLIVAMTAAAGSAIRAEATLSFLGLGIQPPVPSWGNLLSNASSYFFTAPWQVVFPGTLIFLTLISFNFVGDGLRDALDPRMLLGHGGLARDSS
jgi:peptide/nickel transport system permease protein